MNTSGESAEICIVDDDASVLRSMQYLLASDGFAVRAFNKPEDFLAHAGAHHVAGGGARHLDGKGHRAGSSGAAVRTFAAHTRDRHYCARRRGCARNGDANRTSRLFSQTV